MLLSFDLNYNFNHCYKFCISRRSKNSRADYDSQKQAEQEVINRAVDQANQMSPGYNGSEVSLALWSEWLDVTWNVCNTSNINMLENWLNIRHCIDGEYYAADRCISEVTPV